MARRSGGPYFVSMTQTITTILGIIVAVAVVAHLALKLVAAARKKRRAPDAFFARVTPLLQDARYEGEDHAGYPQLVGRYKGLGVRIHPVIDTLAIRKLPSIWLLVSIAEPLPLSATFDLMIRPAGPTTFSNFDHLPVTLEGLPDLPLHALVRTDDPQHVLPYHVVAPHLSVFHDPWAKELLITPKGCRLVWQLAEADRVRYGVFRQADFGDVTLEPDLVRDLLDRLIALRKSILQWYAPS